MGNRGHQAFVIFKVPRISVAGVAQKMRREFSNLDGILEIEINYILDTVSIRYNSDKLTLARIRNKINNS